jgi:hypothetical protein
MAGFDQVLKNVVDLFGGRAANQPGAPARPAPAPPAPAAGQNPDVAAVAQMHAGMWDGAPDETLERLFPGGMTPEQQAFRDAHAAARASDGMIDMDEGRALRAQAHTVGTDQLSFLQSMYLRGHDPAQITALYEKLRGTDSADPGAAGVEHRDQNGAALADPNRLTPEELALWRETQIARFEDMQAGTDMRKIVDPGQGMALATGIGGSPGSTYNANTVGGFVSMAAHTADQDAQQSLATTGLDSGYHAGAGVDMFAPSPASPQQTGTWSPSVQAGGVTALNFDATPAMVDDLNVPLGSFATDQMQLEAQRRMDNRVTRADGTVVQEYVPELLRAETDAAGGVRRDADGLPMLQHVLEMNRGITGNAVDDQANPFTGWGFSSTRRAQDASGGEYPVIPNQELTFTPRQRFPLAEASVVQLDPNSPAQHPIAQTPAGGGPMAPSAGASAAQQWAMYDHQVRLGRTPAPPSVPRP